MELFEFVKSFEIMDKEKVKSLVANGIDAIFLDDEDLKAKFKSDI